MSTPTKFSDIFTPPGDAHDNSLVIVLVGAIVYGLLGVTVNDGLGSLFGEEHTGGIIT